MVPSPSHHQHQATWGAAVLGVTKSWTGLRTEKQQQVVVQASSPPRCFLTKESCRTLESKSLWNLARLLPEKYRPSKIEKKLEQGTTWPAYWEICMQAKKQQLEWHMWQETDSKSGKEYIKACILSPCLFNLYAEYIMKNAGMDEA